MVATPWHCSASLCRLLVCAGLVSAALSGSLLRRITLHLGLNGLGLAKLSQQPLAQDLASLAAPRVAGPDQSHQPGAAAPRAGADATSRKPAEALQGEGLEHWREQVRALAALSPSELLRALREEDPFGVRRFEQELIRQEKSTSRVLSLPEVRSIFSCPPQGRRISLPDLRNHSRKKAFKTGSKRTWLFFQHLQKAGGTHFCSLARSNMPRAQVPRNFCMPDWDWRTQAGHRSAGALGKFANANITRHQRAEGWRIAGNEWQPFEERFFELPGAVFSTSFRKPLDRALSAYRFFCVEGRGHCKSMTVDNWWRRNKLGHNVYTKTFTGEGQRGLLTQIWNASDPAKRKQRGEIAVKALGTVARFNLVLVMEWLAYAGAAVQEALGFQSLDILTQRVRPDDHDRPRNNSEAKIQGARSQDATGDPKERLAPETSRGMSEGLALDELLTDAARRLFLERLVCEDAL